MHTYTTRTTCSYTNVTRLCMPYYDCFTLMPITISGKQPNVFINITLDDQICRLKLAKEKRIVTRKGSITFVLRNFIAANIETTNAGLQFKYLNHNVPTGKYH